MLNFTNFNVKQLQIIFESQKSLTIQLNDRLSKLDKSKLTYYDCYEYNMKEISKHENQFSLLNFERLHPNKEIRDKSVELNKELSTFQIEQSARQDVYDVMLYYFLHQFEEEKQILSHEQITYVEETMITYNMLGLGLENSKKERATEIRKQIAVYALDYHKNISDVNTELIFDLEQLKGMDKEWLSNRLIEGTNKYKIKLQYPDYIPIIETCTNRETRKLMSEKMGSRCLDTNLPILLDTVKLRKEKAELFGFKSHTDFKLQNMMAKNSSTVMNFLTKILNMIKPIVELDKDKLTELAQELDGLNKMESFDRFYYSRIYTERATGLNMEDLTKMFSIESVTNGIFDIYQELLGLTFIDITESNSQALYAPNIKLFCVYDETDKLLEKPMGYFYLDLFPREGKYNHAAMFTFVKGSKYNLPISSIVCNFDPKLNVEFNNVVTYFHEFGHLMHNMVSTVTIPDLSGVSCQLDFLETPSQMFEEWCYCVEPLKKLVMPEFVHLIDIKLVNKIKSQHKQLQGIFNAQQLIFSLLDQAIQYLKILGLIVII